MTKGRKFKASAAFIIAGAIVLTGCGAEKKEPNHSSSAPATSTISVMWNQPFYSANNATSLGANASNANVLYLTNETFNYYDDSLQLQRNEGFGSYQKITDDPLTIKQTLAPTAQWSDGVAVTAADLILAYGAQSGLFNTVTGDAARELQNEDGTIQATSGDAVYFDSRNAGLALITAFPDVSEDLTEVTYTYSRPFGDWEVNLPFTTVTPGRPAHVVANRALDITDPEQGQRAIIEAFRTKDNTSLAKIANVWNSDFNYATMPSDAELAIGTGPYVLKDYPSDQYLTLARNPQYQGTRVPSIDEVVIRFNENPQAATAALQNGEVQIIQPQSTADIRQQIEKMPAIHYEIAEEDTYEHVDLTFNNGGPFDPASYGGDAEKAKLVRQAFLSCLPREQILQTLIQPLNPDAQLRNSFSVVPGAPHYPQTTATNGMAEQYPREDVEKSKELLAQAGVSAPSVRVLYAQKNDRRIQQYQLINESCTKAGFNLIDAGNPEWGRKLGDGTYDAALFGWQSTSTAVTEADINYRTDGRNNYSGYSNPQVDALFDQLQVSIDASEQQQINAEIEKILVDDAFGLTLFQFPSIIAWSENVQNVSASTLSPTYFWNFWQWQL